MTVIKNIAKDRVLQITAALVVLSLFFARPKLADINFSTLFSILDDDCHPDLRVSTYFGLFRLSFDRSGDHQPPAYLAVCAVGYRRRNVFDQ